MRVYRSIATREIDTKISAERETPPNFTLGRENGKGKDVCRRCPPMAHLISPPFSRHVKPLKYEPPRRTDAPTGCVLAAADGRGSSVKPPTNTFPDGRRHRSPPPSRQSKETPCLAVAKSSNRNAPPTDQTGSSGTTTATVSGSKWS